ncbi:MAG TPA: PQQ-dependent dehydrogenase, methanol/ethanol family, partial [Bryobacteraceae bacterium]
MYYAFRLAVLTVAVTCLPVIAQPVTSPVAPQTLLEGLKDPTKWLMFGGDYTSQRHSPLTQITAQNVDRLRPQWMFQSLVPAPGRGFETTPIVADGVMYITGNNNHAWALDA